ncbi:MAG: hypothetical protein ACR2G2_01415, partial [Pseudonocardia sp.]
PPLTLGQMRPQRLVTPSQRLHHNRHSRNRTVAQPKQRLFHREHLLLAAVCVLTRRDADSRPVRSRQAVVEAAMGVGTVIMLVPMI